MLLAPTELFSRMKMVDNERNRDEDGWGEGKRFVDDLLFMVKPHASEDSVGSLAAWPILSVASLILRWMRCTWGCESSYSYATRAMRRKEHQQER